MEKYQIVGFNIGYMVRRLLCIFGFHAWYTTKVGQKLGCTRWFCGV